MASKSAFMGTSNGLLQPNSSSRSHAVSHSLQTQALFGRKATVVAEPEPVAPPKKGLFGLRKAEPVSTGKTKPINKAEEYTRRQGFLGRAVSALDFQEQVKSDAELLYDAKYGKRGEDGRMSREQYGALQRRIRGTAKGFFKEWVDVKGEYVEKGYVSTDSTTVPGLPFLIATVVALLAATAFVVASTS